jgi:hypothetical protein
MIKLNHDSIALRVVEHGWDSPEELTLVVDTIIEADATEMFMGSPRGGRVEDLEDLFTYTSDVSKEIQRIAIALQRNQKDKENLQ